MYNTYLVWADGTKRCEGRAKDKEQHTMIHISIYWKNDSDELLDMLQELGDPGITVGNEGCELVVSHGDYSRILDYIEEHSDQLDLEVHSDSLSWQESRELIDNWKQQSS